MTNHVYLVFVATPPVRSVFARWASWLPHTYSGNWVSISPFMAERCWFNCYDHLMGEQTLSTPQQAEYRGVMLAIDLARHMDFDRSIELPPEPDIYLGPPFAEDPAIFLETVVFA